RYFHRDLGLTLVAYRTRLRLIRFIQLVEGGGRSFLAAAIEADFGSYSQYHRAFQRAFECTPRVFFGTGVSEEMKGRLAPVSIGRASSENSPTRCEDASMPGRVWHGRNAPLP